MSLATHPSSIMTSRPTYEKSQFMDHANAKISLSWYKSVPIRILTLLIL